MRTQKDNLSDLSYEVPDIKALLFNLNHFPLLDLERASKITGSLDMVEQLLPLMVAEDTKQDVEAIERACLAQDWVDIDQIAHKLKGGAMYCGAIRMQFACQYLECYQKAGLTKSLDSLCKQLITVIHDTQQCISNWLR